MSQSSIGWQIGVSILVLGAFIISYLIIAGIVGYVTSLKPVCSAGERALSTDGSRSIVPSGGANSLITPTQDYPSCGPRLTCPEGVQWAVHADGSALTHNCEEPDCKCTAFQHCPAYASTIFRQFGADARISLFQIVDPTIKDKNADGVHDPYDPPYVLFPGNNDRCFLNPATLNMVWPPIQLGSHCLQGILGIISTNTGNYVCAPSQYVDSKTHVFDVNAWTNAYKT